LKSEQYKLISKADLIEENDGNWYPIEYKQGHKGEWDNDETRLPEDTSPLNCSYTLEQVLEQDFLPEAMDDIDSND